ncbi:hypothetical protein QQ045_022242 [Rhodiola kirilowii]
MILGFISLLLTVTQKVISKICIPGHFVSIMLPCKDQDEEGSSETPASAGSRRLLESESAGGGSGHCAAKNMVPMLSVEAVHQLHIFIFVLAVVYVIFCATTMVLGRARVTLTSHLIHLRLLERNLFPSNFKSEHVSDTTMEALGKRNNKNQHQKTISISET